VPFYGLKKIGGIVDNALDFGGGAIREFLGGGDESLVLGIPVNNGVFGDCNFRCKGQVYPIQGLTNWQAFLDGHFGAFKALWPDQTSMRIIHVCLTPGGTANSLVKGPVRASEGVPGIYEEIWLTPFDLTAFLI